SSCGRAATCCSSIPVPDWLDLIAVEASLVAYFVGLRRLWAAAGRGRLVRPGQAMAYLGGLAVVAVALLSPLDSGAHGRLSVHMVQHVLLVGVAAPLLALGAPLPTLLWALPTGWRRRLVPWWRRAAASCAGTAWARWTTVALVLQVAAMWAWHVPALYEAALGSGTLHALEHASFLVTAVVFWWAVTAARHRAMGGVAVIAVFVGALPATALGALMTIAGRPWYPVYPGDPEAALQDQQVAGVVMWGFGGLAALVAAVVLFTAWLSGLDRSAPARRDLVRT
ncbi:MAG: cytochrome c oxidase assembly protein, partial [Actinobacteria bacterium]|nr:cytochrome c oxidase assembly protein [Actinomycetota bacterium]